MSRYYSKVSTSMSIYVVVCHTSYVDKGACRLVTQTCMYVTPVIEDESNHSDILTLSKTTLSM